MQETGEAPLDMAQLQSCPKKSADRNTEQPELLDRGLDRADRCHRSLHHRQPSQLRLKLNRQFSFTLAILHG